MKAMKAGAIDRKPRELMGNRRAFVQPPAPRGGVSAEILDGEFDPRGLKS